MIGADTPGGGVVMQIAQGRSFHARQTACVNPLMDKSLASSSNSHRAGVASK